MDILVNGMKTPLEVDGVDAATSAHAVAAAATAAALLYQPKFVEAPAAANSTGTAGSIAFDATHIYVCVETDTWVRADLATWGG